MSARAWTCRTGLAALWLLVLLVARPVLAADQPTVAPAAEPYAKADGLSGSLTIVGSDTLNNLMTLWAESFRKLYPAVAIRLEAKKTGAVSPALADGTAHLVHLSRLMDDGEVAKFQAKHGYRPTPYAVAVDALVVYVHKDNQLEGLTLDQVRAVFSKSPASSYDRVASWGQLYVGGEWENAPLRLYGRDAASGTTEFFKEHALARNELRDDVRLFTESAALIKALGEDRFGIGYSGLAAIGPDVRPVPLAADEFSPYVEPTFDNVKNRRYPLRRYLYVYVDQEPRKILRGKKPLPPVVREFLRYVYSQDGQAFVTKDGYFPVEDWIVERAQKTIK
jgi:phosphate transport system substrate-binding protein